MRVLVQRVSQARVVVAGLETGAIGRGLLALAGFAAEDGQEDLAWMSGKLARLRVFPDEQGLMNRSLADLGGGMLVISQFTLFARVRKGNRPSYLGAARPEHALPLYQAFVRRLACDLGREVATGVFGADMQVSLVNDGPVTLMLDSRDPE